MAVRKIKSGELHGHPYDPHRPSPYENNKYHENKLLIIRCLWFVK